MLCDRWGGVLCRPHAGSDERKNGTQDVNDPVYGPATQSKGRSGSFTSWVPRVVLAEQVRRSYTVRNMHVRGVVASVDGRAF